MLTPLPQDPTLDEVRAALIADVATNAAFDGWGPQAVATAAQMHGLDPDIARLAFNDGAVAMIDAWFLAIDAEMSSRLPPETLAAMKIRARITALVETRLDIVAPDRESLRRAAAILAMPQNLPRAAKKTESTHGVSLLRPPLRCVGEERATTEAPESARARVR